MLLPRIIPCLLLKEKSLVKTIKFTDPKYIGDPLNAVKIFNEKQVDELIILDIEATKNNIEPNFILIEKIANESRMPFCYGGGVKNIEQMRRIVELGAEKIAISSSAIYDPELITKSANIFGSQSIVVVLDIRKKRFSNGYEIVVNNGKDFTGFSPEMMIERSISKGAGEILINSYDNDGMRKGYDLNFIKTMKNKYQIPFTFLGGADNLDSILELWNNIGNVGAAAGSMFTLKGKYRAVLIQYPSLEKKKEVYKKFYNLKLQ